jgi:hypothetical protein
MNDRLALLFMNGFEEQPNTASSLNLPPFLSGTRTYPSLFAPIEGRWPSS